MPFRLKFCDVGVLYNGKINFHFTLCDKLNCHHKTAASVWGLVALKLADEELLPFNYLSYSHELQVCLETLITIIKLTL